MILCEEITREEWSPDFSLSSQTSITWQRLDCQGVMLCNSLEDADWLTNPVQVELCQSCGVEGCSTNGYVHCSTLDGFVFWTRPQSKRHGASTAVAQHGSVAFSSDIWEQLRTGVSGIPSADSLNRTNRIALAGAWANGPARPADLSRLLPMLQSQLLAADSLSRQEALRWMAHWLHWFEQGDEIPVGIRLTLLATSQLEVETLYLENCPGGAWPALARRGEAFVPLLGTGHALLLNPSPGGRYTER